MLSEKINRTACREGGAGEPVRVTKNPRCPLRDAHRSATLGQYGRVNKLWISGARDYRFCHDRFPFSH